MGEPVCFEVSAVEPEPESKAPADLTEALDASPAAYMTWENTTAVARLDWTHWTASAKQAQTRTKRIHDACDMLAAGKKRVCCFDASG